jgi:hypothetical protein
MVSSSCPMPSSPKCQGRNHGRGSPRWFHGVIPLPYTSSPERISLPAWMSFNPFLKTVAAFLRFALQGALPICFLKEVNP